MIKIVSVVTRSHFQKKKTLVGKPYHRLEPERWLAKAKNDLTMARNFFAVGGYNYAAYSARMVSLTN